MVLHVGRLRSGDLTAVTDDIAAVVAVAEGRIVKGEKGKPHREADLGSWVLPMPVSPVI